MIPFQTMPYHQVGRCARHRASCGPSRLYQRPHADYLLTTDRHRLFRSSVESQHLCDEQLHRVGVLGSGCVCRVFDATPWFSHSLSTVHASPITSHGRHPVISKINASVKSGIQKFERLAVMALDHRPAVTCAAILPNAHVLVLGILGIAVNPANRLSIACGCLAILFLNLLVIRRFWVAFIGAIVMWWAYFKYGPETELAVYNHHEHKAEFANTRGLKDFRIAVAAVARKLGEA